MIADARTATGPGGQAGTTLQSSVTGPTPAAGSSEKSLPGPATNSPTPAAASKLSVLPPVPGAFHQRRTAAVVKRTLLDDGEDRRTLVRREWPPLTQRGAMSGPPWNTFTSTGGAAIPTEQSPSPTD